MILVTIQLCPLGDRSNPEELGRIEISNDATGTHEVGNYNVKLFKRGGSKSIWRQGKVMGFPRKRLGSYDLLLRALLVLVKDRNSKAVAEAELREKGVR